MSRTISSTTATVTTTVSNRTWRFEVFSDYKTDPQIIAHRQQITQDQEGNDIGSPNMSLPNVTRSASGILTDSITLSDGTTTLTGAQLVEAIAAMIDKWEAADDAST